MNPNKVSVATALMLLLGSSTFAQNLPSVPDLQKVAQPEQPKQEQPRQEFQPTPVSPELLAFEQCRESMMLWKQRQAQGVPPAQLGPEPNCGAIMANAGNGAQQPQQQAGVPMQQGQSDQMAQAQQVRTPPPKPLIPGEGVPRDDFAKVFNSLMPLSADQVRETHRHMDELEKAMSYRKTPPKIVNRSVKASIAPGAPVPTIQLASGFVTSLVFTDLTGSPWPVLQVTSGDPNFVVQEPLKGLRTNISTLYTTRNYGVSNAMVFLEGAPAPLPLTLIAGEPNADGRVDVQVSTQSQHSLESMAQGLAHVDPAMPRINDSPEMAEMLQGIVPKGLRPLVVRGNMSSHVQAWSSAKGDLIYLRTSMQIQAPAPVRAGRSVDGTNAYVIPRAEMISFFDRGNTYEITVSGLSSPLGTVFNQQTRR